MLYAALKTIHLLSITLWLGGMFFALFCLRPSLGMLEAPQRLRLMHEVLRRFFDAVLIAAGLALATGVWMIAGDARAAGRAGVGLNMPIDWYVMAVLGMLMVAIFAVVRFTLYPRLTRAVQSQAWPEAARVLGSIARAVQVNLVLGVIIIVVTRAGSAL
ncbi:MAG: CopD family protein [Burkholderiaceae bacterium]